MKAVIQRVKSASVTVDGQIVSKISNGILVLLGIKNDDNKKDIDYMINKISNLRIFPDENNIMNKSLIDYSYELLLVSNFTIYGETKKGRRPSYGKSAKSEEAKKIYDQFLESLSKTGIKFSSGIFQAMMDVKLINDGPITLIIES